jgi:hypothetical protein
MARIRSTRKLVTPMYQPPGRSAMAAIGHALIDQIRARTQSGLDENNRPFAPYAGTRTVTVQGRDTRGRFGPGHRETKNFSRRRKRNGQPYGTVVDLTDSGDMLDQMAPFQQTDRSVRVGWRSTKLKNRATYHERGAGHLPVRRFLAVPRSWVVDAVNRLWRPWKRG